MEQTAAVIAFVYAVAAGSGAGLGDGVAPGEAVPEAARGLLLPGHGVVQLAPGARARAGPEAGRIELLAGRARAVAEDTLELAIAGTVVRLGPGAAGLVTAGPEPEVCAESDRLAVDLAAGDEGFVEPGTCSRVSAGGLVEAGPLEAAAVEPLRDLAGSAPPRRPELPPLVEDPLEAAAAIEVEQADELERGARQEAAACGCSEDGGGGGSLDTGGGGPPSPEPEPLPSGTVRVRVRVPAR